MRSALLLAFACVPTLLACVADAPLDADEDTSTSEADASDTGESAEPGDGDGDGDGEAEGDGDGDDEPPPIPADLPTPTGECPTFANGNATFSPATIAPRDVKLWVGDNPEPGGMLVIYWHAYGSVPDEAAFTLTQPVIDAILDAGGVIAAPYPAEDVGEFPWFSVNVSERVDDMLVGDEIVACAIEQLGIDPRRIHATGMSAGGIQTVAFSMARSRYIASAASFSGGEYVEQPFEDAENRFAAMIIHGGDNDLFGGFVNFKALSTVWFNQLSANGNFAFICDHGGGHTIPAGYGDDVINFFFAHPFGTEPSPYADGLPANIPSACAL